MSNIHLHSNNKSSLLKDDINNDTKYRESLPYDAMGDYSVIDSIPSSYFCADDFRVEIPTSKELNIDVHKLSNSIDKITELLELDMSDSWSCVAEKNYYWTFGG